MQIGDAITLINFNGQKFLGRILKIYPDEQNPKKNPPKLNIEISHPSGVTQTFAKIDKLPVGKLMRRKGIPYWDNVKEESKKDQTDAEKKSLRDRLLGK